MNGNSISKYRFFTKTPWDSKAAAYYTLLALATVIYAILTDYARADAAASGPKDAAFLIISSACCVLPLFFILAISKWVFTVFMPFIFYIGAMGHIYAKTYLFDTTYKTAPLFFKNGTVSSIAADPDMAAFMGGMFALGLAIGLIRFFYVKDKSAVRKGQAFAAILIVAGIAAAFIKEKYPNFIPQPYAYMGAMQKFATDKVYGIFFKDEREKSLASGGNEVTGVLIFADKLSGNKKYAPGNGNVIENFSQNFGSPRHNLLSALTGAGKNEAAGITVYPTLLSDFKNAGYPVRWFTSSNKLSVSDGYIGKLAEKEAETYEIKNNKGTPNPFLAMDSLKDFTDNGNRGLFIVYIEGTPPKIISRYPEIFQIEGGKDSPEKAYEGYAAYLNALVSETRKRLSGKKAFIILAGMEGEDISGFNDFKTDPLNRPDSILWVWLSPELEAIYGGAKQYGDPENHGPDMIYHTALGCAGIKTPRLDETKNLCRQNAK